MSPTETPPTFRAPDEVLGDVYRKFETKRRHRRVLRTGIAAAALAVAVAVGAVVLPGRPQRHLRVVGENGLAPASAKAIAKGTWSELPDAPIGGRHGAAIVWTGDEMLVWGGESPNAMNDGAAYRPKTRTWRKLPSAPIGGRQEPSTLWTGHELLVWGGVESMADGTARDVNTGTAYDAAADRWRMLATAPLTPRAGATMVWTGKEAIVLGGANVGGPVPYFTDVAAYDPVADRWRVLPPVPVVAGHHLIDNPLAVAAGDTVLIWWAWGGPTTDANAGYDLYSYSAVTNSWEVVPVPTDMPRGIAQPLWTGADVLVPQQPGVTGPSLGQPGLRYDPVAKRWQPMAHGPVDDSTGRMVWTGQALVRMTPDATGEIKGGDGAVWDATTGGWTSLPRAMGPLPTNAVWTGREVLFWGVAVRGLRFGPETAVERASLIDSEKARSTCESGRGSGGVLADARLVAAFDSTAGEITRWERTRNGPSGPFVEGSLAARSPADIYMVVCYFDGGVYTPSVPPGVALPVYNRARIEATAAGAASDGIGCFHSENCAVGHGELDIQRP